MLRQFRVWRRFRQAVRKASRGDLPHLPGNKDIVVLPCWRRPEFLWHCLDNMTRAEGVDSVHVLFRPDSGFSPDNLEVIESFADRLSSFEVQTADPCPFRRTKPSANLLLGCLHAAAAAKRYVFLVEEDIMVARDFFAWHRSVHAAAGPLFCSIPVKNRNRLLTLPDEVDGYYLSSGDSVVVDRFDAVVPELAPVNKILGNSAEDGIWTSKVDLLNRAGRVVSA